MRVCIAGSPSVDDTLNISEAIGLSQFDVTRIMADTEPGCGRTAIKWSAKHHIKLQIFPIERKLFGENGWAQRNHKMTNWSHALIIIWTYPDEISRHLLRCFRQQKKPYYIYYVEGMETSVQ